MILTRQFHNIKCDNCGRQLQEEWYEDPKDFDTPLWASGWIGHKGKHYCPDCYSYDDNNNLIIKKMSKTCLNCKRYHISMGDFLSSCDGIICDPYDIKPCRDHKRCSLWQWFHNRVRMYLQKQNGIR